MPEPHRRLPTLIHAYRRPCTVLNMSELRRRGLLTPGSYGLVEQVRIECIERDMLVVAGVALRLHLMGGGFGPRVHAECPHCGRTMRRVFVVDDDVGPRAGCSHCLRCWTTTSGTRGADRFAAHEQRRRRQFGWPVSLLAPEGERPAGMHRRTFSALRMKLVHQTLGHRTREQRRAFVLQLLSVPEEADM